MPALGAVLQETLTVGAVAVLGFDIHVRDQLGFDGCSRISLHECCSSSSLQWFAHPKALLNSLDTGHAVMHNASAAGNRTEEQTVCDLGSEHLADVEQNGRMDAPILAASRHC